MTSSERSSRERRGSAPSTRRSTSATSPRCASPRPSRRSSNSHDGLLPATGGSRLLFTWAGHIVMNLGILLGAILRIVVDASGPYEVPADAVKGAGLELSRCDLYGVDCET